MLQFGTDCKIVKIVLKVHHVSYNVYLLHYCKLYSNLFYSDDTNICTLRNTFYQEDK